MQRLEIRFEGQIDQTWMEWFECLSITYDQTENVTTLICELPDSAALYGTIARLRDLGLKLVSVNPQQKGMDE